MERFAECFSPLVDPRKNQAQYDLTEMLFKALLPTLCGATTCCDIALFGRSKEALLRTILMLEHGIPSHDTFSRVFRILDPGSFEEKAFATAAKIKGMVALDGKALRRAYECGQRHVPPVMVTAWSAMTRMALVDMLAPGNNEAAGALQLVKLLQLKGCVVTADALHCHREMAKAIVRRGGDYVLAVKNNQPGLLRDAKAEISAAERKKAKQATTKDADHGRKETRTAIVTPVKDMAENRDFPGLAAVARMTSKRGRDNTVQRYFLLTQWYTPTELLRIVREHWGIENVLHWTLDVVLDEDQARSRKDHAHANLAVLQRLALNPARAHPDTKTSLRGKLKRAAWDDSFLVDMLLNLR